MLFLALKKVQILEITPALVLTIQYKKITPAKFLIPPSHHIVGQIYPPALTTIWKTLCMEYCCYVWAGAPSCSLELLDKPQKQICRAVGPSFVASPEPLDHH